MHPMVSGMFVEVFNHSSRKYIQWIDNEKLIKVAQTQKMRAELIIENDTLIGSRLYLMKDHKTGEFILPPFFLEICSGVDIIPFVEVDQELYNAGRTIRSPMDVMVNVEEYLEPSGAAEDFSRVICDPDGMPFYFKYKEQGRVSFQINLYPFFSIWAQLNRGTHIVILRHHLNMSTGAKRMLITADLYFQGMLHEFIQKASQKNNPYERFTEPVLIAVNNLDGLTNWHPYIRE